MKKMEGEKDVEKEGKKNWIDQLIYNPLQYMFWCFDIAEDVIQILFAPICKIRSENFSGERNNGMFSGLFGECGVIG